MNATGNIIGSISGSVNGMGPNNVNNYNGGEVAGDEGPSVSSSVSIRYGLRSIQINKWDISYEQLRELFPEVRTF